MIPFIPSAPTFGQIILVTLRERAREYVTKKGFSRICGCSLVCALSILFLHHITCGPFSITLWLASASRRSTTGRTLIWPSSDLMLRRKSNLNLHSQSLHGLNLVRPVNLKNYLYFVHLNFSYFIADTVSTFKRLKL